MQLFKEVVIKMKLCPKCKINMRNELKSLVNAVANSTPAEKGLPKGSGWLLCVKCGYKEKR